MLHYYTIAIVFVINISNAIIHQSGGGYDDASQLIWAPISTVIRPYVTFINDFNRPTWSTRHTLTKQKTQFQPLQLPKNVPFAIVCGACFQKSNLRANLTVTISNHLSQSVPKKKWDGSLEYNVGFNECLMTYMITEPIRQDGSITCTLNRGIGKNKEVISFNAVNINIEKKTAEELEIGKGDGELLHCPNITNIIHDPVIYAWYILQGERNKSVLSRPITSTGRTVTLLLLNNNNNNNNNNNKPTTRKSTTVLVVCSVYQINTTPTVVFQLRYKIPNHVLRGEYDFDEEKAYQHSHRRVSLSNPIIAIIIIVVIVFGIVVIVCGYQFVITFSVS